MFKILTCLLSLVTIAGMIGCGSSRLRPNSGATATKAGVISLWADWVKDKGDKFDVRVNLRNDSTKEALIVNLHDFNCFRGQTRGKFRHTFFNTGERTFDLQPNEHKEFNAVCVTGDASGPFRLEILKVYENPNMDGQSRGKILAKNLRWSMTEPE